MTKNIRPRGEDIRYFILKNIDKQGLTTKVAEHFEISRQAANLHMQHLVTEGALVAVGNTNSRTYKLAPKASVSFLYKIEKGLEEDVVWRKDIRPYLDALPQNVLDIWQYAFTEMFNNAIDHSGGTTIYVNVTKTAIDTQIAIADDGIGIFTKIQKECDLADERQAIFELSKGKLTTDSKNHSGQGIFFTSRMVSDFDIISGGVIFTHEMGREHDFILERKTYQSGTTIFLKVGNHTSQTIQKVYSKYSVKNSLGFDKTVIPVRLAKYGADQLISRSQAKRVLARVELFQQVIFDFSDIDIIGQAFADQIFRVFASEHSEVRLSTRGANKAIQSLINFTIKSGRPGFKGKSLED